MPHATWSGVALATVLAFVLAFPANPVETQAESSLALSLRTECAEITMLETATVRAFLAIDGVGVPGARLAVRSSGGGAFTIPVDLAEGRYEFSWTAPRVVWQTYVALYVRAHTERYGNVTSRIVFLVDPYRENTLSPTQLFLLAWSPSPTVRPGGTVDIGLSVFTIEGFIVSNVTISTAVRDPSFGTLSAASRRGCGYVLAFTASSSITGATAVLISIVAVKVGYSVGATRLSLMIVPY